MFIIKIVNGGVKDPVDEKMLKEYNEGKYQFIDTYVAEQVKDNVNFMNLTPFLKKAQEFDSVKQAKGIVEYLKHTNTQKGKDFTIIVEELILKTKGVKNG